MLKSRNFIALVFCVGVLATPYFSQVTILNEDFQNGIPSNWGLRNFDGLTPAAPVVDYTDAWIVKNDPDSAANKVASSTSYFSPVGIANRWLITPAISLGSFGNHVKWRARSQDASFPDNYLVLVSKTDTAIASFTDTVGYVIGEYVNWTERNANLSEMGLNNETIYLAFVLQTNDGFILYVDDVNVRKEDPLSVAQNQEVLFKIATIDATGLYEILHENASFQSTVYNAKGEEILQTTESVLDLRNETAGVYFLCVKSENNSVTQKLIKF